MHFRRVQGPWLHQLCMCTSEPAPLGEEGPLANPPPEEKCLVLLHYLHFHQGRLLKP